MRHGVKKEDQFVWSDERVQQLRKLYDAGLSCSEIAAELGGNVSRNAVIGKLHRIGLKRGPMPGRKRGSTFTAPRERVAKPRPVVVIAPRFKPAPPAKPWVDAPAVVPGQVLATRIPLLETHKHHCRWPAADDGSARMVCGAQSLPDLPYCAHHMRVSCRGEAA